MLSRRSVFFWATIAMSTAQLHAQPVIAAIINGASSGATLSPGCWASIYGTKLAAAVSFASSVPLPKKLGETSVSVAGVAAPVKYVSANQVNFLVPFEITIPQNSVVPVTVTTAEGTSAAFNLRLVLDAPAIFTKDGSGLGPALVFNGAFQPVDTLDGSTIILYATGLGPVSPAVPSENGGASTEPLNRTVDPFEVYVGDAKAAVPFAGLAPGFPGVYQLNVVPPSPMSGRLYIRSGAWQSNVTDVGIAAGSNVANVTGTIAGLYPPTELNQPPAFATSLSPSIGASVLPVAGGFSAAFDIKPDAKPFSLVAAGETGQVLIMFDPPKGTYQATIVVPTQQARAGDFSSAEFKPVWDLSSCLNAVCSPFPGNMIPGKLMDPVWALVSQVLPLPNVASPPASTGFVITSGSAPAGSRFVINRTTQSQLSTFGGFLQISPGAPKTRTTTFQLYVDGKLVASQDAAYSVP